ncbi:MAG: NADH-quinone oxidoreductase subunit K [Anaerolineaceae bacterium]|nr:NADH-quinone oxidoreductase subunit K [Anaerolineaceae bacterium]
MNALQIALAGAFILLGIGLYGLLVIRNMIKIVIAIQIMVKGAMLALVVAGKLNGQLNVGQSLALTVITADTIVVIIGLGLAIRIQQRRGTLDVDEVINLEG